MGASDILKEYFFFIENNKDIEDGNYPDASELMCRIRDTDIWNHFIEKSFDSVELQEYFTSLSSEVRSRIFKFGISCFVHFVQANFTGPDLTSDVTDIFNNPKIVAIDFPKFLTLNNEEINVNTKHPILLVVSKCIFEKCLVANIVNSLWTWRSIIIHQQIMEELSPLLLSQADALKKQITTFNLKGYEKAKFDIEFAQLYLTFHHVAKAKEHIYSADDILGVQFSLQGKLSKRAKHQEKDTAQLTLEISISSDNPEIKRPPVLDFDIPKNIKTHEPKSEKASNNKEAPTKGSSSTKNISIPNTEQKLFLARVNEMMIAKPQEDLQIGELRPFIDLLLNQKNTWAVRVATLLLRCKIETLFGKVVEKTLAQCREIMDCYDRPNPHILSRFADVFSTGLVPMWRVEVQCAEVLMQLGLNKHALDVYKKVQQWENINGCYVRLKDKQKGIDLIKKKCEEKESVRMLCVLGDITDDVSCYEKAWELSKKRSHRAQRQWGHFFYTRKQYSECIPHYEKSVSINPLQSQVWLRLGVAAQQTELWHVAATAYRRYTNLEPDGFQAWNNLAQAYIKINNKRSAQNALLEALKYNYESWKIWENLLLVSTDTYSYGNIIKAYHKVLDLKGKYLNLEALNILVFNVCNEVSDEHKRAELRLHDEPENLMQKCRELLGRVVSIYPGEGYIWELYASLVPPSLLRAQRFQRAFRAYTQAGWDKNPQTCVQVMCLCIKLAELVLTKGVDLQDHLLSSVKTNLTSAVSATKKHDWEESRSLVDEVSVHLERLVEKVKRLAEKNSEINNGERLVIR